MNEIHFHRRKKRHFNWQRNYTLQPAVKTSKTCTTENTLSQPAQLHTSSMLQLRPLYLDHMKQGRHGKVKSGLTESSMAYLFTRWAKRLQIHKEKMSPSKRGIKPLEKKKTNANTWLTTRQWWWSTTYDLKWTWRDQRIELKGWGDLRKEAQDAFLFVDCDDWVKHSAEKRRQSFSIWRGSQLHSFLKSNVTTLPVFCFSSNELDHAS